MTNKILFIKFQAIACLTVIYVINIEDSYTLERNILMKPPSYCLSIRYTPVMDVYPGKEI